MPRLHHVMAKTRGMKAPNCTAGGTVSSETLPVLCLATEPVMVLWLSPLATSEWHMVLATRAYLNEVHEVL